MKDIKTVFLVVGMMSLLLLSSCITYTSVDVRRDREKLLREHEAFKQIVQEFDIRREKARETYTHLYKLWSDCEGNLDLQIEALTECLRNRQN